jgi:pyridoxal phosphate enzyme (YggS family)
MNSTDATFEACALVLDKIAAAHQKCELLPVSKGQNLEVIRNFWATHPKLPRRLGENYIEELHKKDAELGTSVEWHFLGRLQSRKLASICEQASVLHALTRRKELEFLAKLSAAPRFFIQINISEEDVKNGLQANELPALLDDVNRLGLDAKFMGLMGMAAPVEKVGENVVRDSFAKLRELRDRWCPASDLSMGMSNDYDLALREGSNWIRIGSLLFGSRVPKLS